MSPRPTIVAIIGSSRFRDYMQGIAQVETLKGHIVLLPGFYHHADKYPITDAKKKQLDELTLRKIDLADEVICCQPNGYVGSSTKRQLDYCITMKKPIGIWDQPNIPAPTESQF